MDNGGDMNEDSMTIEDVRSRILEEKVGRTLCNLYYSGLATYDVCTPEGRAALAGYLRELAGHIESFDPTREGGWYES